MDFVTALCSVFCFLCFFFFTDSFFDVVATVLFSDSKIRCIVFASPSQCMSAYSGFFFHNHKQQVLAKLQIPWRCPFVITSVSSLEFRLVTLGEETVSVSAIGTDLEVQHDQVVSQQSIS
jgi:hypothetical protein